MGTALKVVGWALLIAVGTPIVITAAGAIVTFWTIIYVVASVPG